MDIAEHSLAELLLETSHIALVPALEARSEVEHVRFQVQRAAESTDVKLEL